jgi:CRISPR-associated protein Csa3
MTVMICTVGESPEPIEYGIYNHENRPNNIFLIGTKEVKHVSEQIIKKTKKIFPHIKFHTKEINSKTNLEEMMSKIIEIYSKHPKTTIDINITGGTKVMSSAAMIAAYFTGTNVFYIDEKGKNPQEKIIKLPIPKFDFKKILKEKDKIILSHIITNEKTGKTQNQTQIAKALNENTKSLNHRLRTLEQKGLITINKKGRISEPKITTAGKLIFELKNTPDNT